MSIGSVTQHGIRAAHSCAADPCQAAFEFHGDVLQPDTALVLFFCSSEYDLEVLAREMRRLFAGVEVIGCTTAGEIGPAGYRDHSLSGVSFSASICTAVTGHLDNLHSFGIAEGRNYAKDLLSQLEDRTAVVSGENSFAFLMIDGLSVREELVAHVLQATLGTIPLVGGSAGDGMHFARTHVYHDGRFHADSAVLALVTTTLPVMAFKIQHFVPGEERVVVTEADPEHRIVKEINGRPAAREYARVTGVGQDYLSPDCFARSPVVVLIDGANYVRSIQKVNPDDSLTFYCAIEEGLVLRVARGHNLEENLAEAFERLQNQVGPLQLVLGCDCILRKLEIIHNGLQDAVENLLGRYNMVGFNTYGEQFRGIHINQTLTGIAIGSAREPADA